jgi:hypothetical protein
MDPVAARTERNRAAENQPAWAFTGRAEVAKGKLKL